jgi:hypothetical protein
MTKRVPLERLRHISKQRQSDAWILLEWRPTSAMSREAKLNGQSRPTASLHGEAMMVQYNVFTDCGGGDRLSRVYSFTARDDVAAEKFVTDRLTSRPVELWCCSRKVRRFEGKQLRNGAARA